ncbi:Pr6Pr family membrane protein [Aquidulcibacter sp.]|uniref:Pr6Pr family membrane protein n=1 Tax=Aquidulcibacter sp. TaxID=2052990 RepID=UPI000BCDE238|nr:MAG: hypothetical protein CFE27_04100 [Alphaproteobacteria bacterium PA1]HCP65895.1 hypothetical protein [Hyphomonadaceae bacterium]
MTTYPPKPAAKLFAGLLCLFTCAALILQSWISVGWTMRDGMGLADSLWRLTGYFTILTNSLIAISMGLIATSPKGPKIFPNHALAALTFYITTMGVIYHLLLSGGRNLSGLNLIGDLGVHYVVPALTLLWWALFADKDEVKFGHAVIWLAWPLLYTSAALLRGRFEDWYPYFFLDVGKYGLGQIGLNVLGLGLGFLVMGLLFVILAKGLKRLQSRPL